jgi:hypothetical protein
MTAPEFKPPNYYTPRRSPSPLLVALIAIVLVVLIGGALAVMLQLGPFGPGTSQPTSLPTSPTGSSASALPTQPTQRPSLESPEATRNPPSELPTQSPTYTGPPPTANDATAQLLAHVPEAIRPTCVAGAFTAPVVALVNCVSGIEVTVTYSAYPDAGAMYADYDASVDRAQFDRDSGLCYQTNPDGTVTATPTKWPSEHSYTIGGDSAGRYFCIERGLPTITWTDKRLNIGAVATASTGDFERLVGFWLNEAGPIP